MEVSKLKSPMWLSVSYAKLQEHVGVVMLLASHTGVCSQLTCFVF